ncbi:MAG: hypothetical protein N2255_03050 [Kiritimatiellae bacterium]|nr:hypothetical protein [Kiritimatiellia bacterium]
MARIRAALVVMALAWSSVSFGVTFTRGPTATRVGNTVKLAFELDEPADVEVAVFNESGTVVRHLVAGLVSATNIPPAPLTRGLSQQITWDGRDDEGKPVNGPVKIRVRAGLKPVFDGFLLYNPEATGPVAALAVGPGGNVYLFHHDATALPSHWGSKKIKIISPEGRHVRAILPFPAHIAPERIAGAAPFVDTDGTLVPRIHHLRALSFYPDPAENFANHQTPVVDSKGRVYWLVLGPRLACVDAEGGIPYPTFMSEPLLPEIPNLRMRNQYLYSRDTPSLALSSDEKFLYLAGLWVGEFGKDKEHRPVPCVFRLPVETRGPAEVFVGKLDTPGTEKGLLVSPRGLATANGLLYVADPQANRIAIFQENDRSFVGQIEVEDPEGLAVDPRSGAVYVCVYTGKPNPNGKQTADLVKFDGWRTAKELYRITLPKTGLNPNTGVHRIAMDAVSQPVRIWIPDIPYSPCRLKCIEDTGEKFVDKGDPRDLKTPWAEGPRDLSLDRRRGELYVKSTNQKWFRIEEKTGRVVDVVDLNKVYKYNLNSSDKGTQMVVHPDGTLISMSWQTGLVRHDRNGTPINWPGRDTDRIPYGGIMNFMQRTLAVPNAEELYVIFPPIYRLSEEEKKQLEASKEAGRRYCSVDVLGLDGQIRRTVIWQCTHGAILRVDSKGNIYLAEPVKPPGRLYPPFFDGKLKPMLRALTPGEGRDAFWNSYMYGSIVKFPPSGGAIWYDPQRRVSPSAAGQPPADLLAKPAIKVQAHLVYTPNAPAEIQGAEWYRFGFAPFAMHSGSDTCMCEGAGFDIDLYGRVFYPNLGQFRVEVVDAMNNWLCAFGRYGNQDSPNLPTTLAKTEKPDMAKDTAVIPFAWPLTVAVSDTHAYVADTINRRVVKVRLDSALTAYCDLR